MSEQGEADHRLPRGRARPGRRGAARHRPGAQGHDPAARPGARLHDGAARPRTSTPQTRAEMLDQLAYMLGGRAAEEMVFHDPTTGAGNDIEKATSAGPRDGHPVRHDRAARRDQARRRQRRAVPGPRHGPPARLLRGRRRDRRRGGQEAARRPPTRRRSTSSVENRDVLDALVLALLEQGDARQGARSPRSSSRCAGAPTRPAWTGSPDRDAVDDPAGRDPRRRSATGADGQRRQPDERARRRRCSRPPGAGGDVHGDPGVGAGHSRRPRDRPDG